MRIFKLGFGFQVDEREREREGMREKRELNHVWTEALIYSF